MTPQRPPTRIVLGGFDGEGQQNWERVSPVRIGSQNDLEVVLDDTSVNPHHASLVSGEHGWLLEVNGGALTCLNGILVTTPQKVSRGDVIHCGSRGLKVIDLEEPAVHIRRQLPSPSEGTGAGSAMKIEAVAHRSWEEGLQDLVDRSDRVTHGKHLFTLLRAGYHLAHVSSLRELLQSVLDDTVAVLDASQGTMLLVDEGTGKPQALVHSSVGDRNSVPEFSMSLATRCFARGESLLCSDVSALSASQRGQSLASGSINSVVCGMLRSPGKRLGVMQLFRTSRQELFTPDDMQLADAVAASASVGVECALAIEQHRRPFLQKISDFVCRAVALRDPHLGHHNERVQAYAVLLAKQVGTPPEEYQRIHLGAGLHDLGKLVMADAVLNKPGWLTHEEIEKMKQATLRGVALAAAFPELTPILPIIRHHHERWDGTGYPDGLKGVAIPFGARVVAIANCFDAMTVDQPYRAALTPAQAFAELKAGAGSQFDPELVDAFLHLRPKLEHLFANYRTERPAECTPVADRASTKQNELELELMESTHSGAF